MLMQLNWSFDSVQITKSVIAISLSTVVLEIDVLHLKTESNGEESM